MNKNYADYKDFSDNCENIATYDAGFDLPEATVFIKEDEYNGKMLWSIYDAEGVRLAVTEDRACAFEIARQNDYQANSVH
jgi:hypothetical protein